MTKTVSLSENISIQSIIALTHSGNEVVIEENGEPIEKNAAPKQRILGLGRGEDYFMSDDFDADCPFVWKEVQLLMRFFFFLHHFHKLPEQIFRIMWSRRGFRVILD